MKNIFWIIFIFSSCASYNKDSVSSSQSIEEIQDIEQSILNEDVIIDINSLTPGSIRRIKIETPPNELDEEDPLEIESEISSIQSMLLTDFEKSFFELGKKAPIKDKTYGYPLADMNKISSSFGMRKGKLHAGIDYPRPIGTKINSIQDGLVVFSGVKKGYGYVVILRHSDEIYSVYAHASKILVNKGDLIKKGHVLALVGSSGRSTGPHLHFEIRNGNKPVNPLLFYKQNLAFN